LQPLTLFFNIYAHRLCAGGHKKIIIIILFTMFIALSTVIITQVILRVHPGHLMNVKQHQALIQMC